MNNTSTEPGYLTPVGPVPDYDIALEKKISQWVRGVTGINVNLVFPRWTDPQTQIPKNGTTWCEFGITVADQDDFQADVQISDEQSEQWTWEKISIIFCFYGPQGNAMASLFRAGMFVEQNSNTLKANTGLSLTDVTKILNLPVLINNQWVRRYDLTVTLSRKNTRTFNVRTVITPNVIVNGE